VVYGGVHVGLTSLYGVALQKEGRVLSQAHGRFRDPAEMAQVLDRVTNQIKEELDGREVLWTLALEKPQRLTLAPKRVDMAKVRFRPNVIQPALSAVLLGAVPSVPSLLISLGREVRFALIDSTHTFKEYRVMEGGGTWWQKEIPRLAAHSQRLQVHLKTYPDGVPPLSRLPSLLELGSPPTPDPVLKPRLEKIAEKLAQMAATLVHRMPGIQRYYISGFLGQSILGEQISRGLSELAKPSTQRFPPEVGAALCSLALERENWERSHLNKDPFEQDLSVDEWAPPAVLVRRLYRMRKPFEQYTSSQP
jgi:hypothetical protein